MDDEKPLCPICRDCRLETARFSRKIGHRGRSIEVEELECWLCLECGATPEFDDQRRRNQQRIEQALARSDRQPAAAAAGLCLYTHPRSRGRMIRWLLEEAGVGYEAVVVDYGAAMQTDEYRAINPMRKVPALVHGDAVVTECAAICAYVADAFPDAGLAPPPEARADYYRWLFFSAGPLEAAIVNQALGVTPNDEQKGFVGYGDLGRVVDTLERAVSRGPFIAGKRFSAADIHVGSQIRFGLEFGTLEKRPALVEYAGRVTDREAFRKAASMDDADLAQAAG